MTILFLSCLIAVAMLVWFNSEAVIEYGSLIGLRKFLGVDGFVDAKIQAAPSSLSYPSYIKMKYNCFATRLLGCKLCTCIFFSILVTAPMSIISVPVVCVGALILYGAITKLMDLK